MKEAELNRILAVSPAELAQGDKLARGYWEVRDAAIQVRGPEAQRLGGPEENLRVSGLGNRGSGTGCQVQVRVRGLNPGPEPVPGAEHLNPGPDG